MSREKKEKVDPRIVDLRLHLQEILINGPSEENILKIMKSGYRVWNWGTGLPIEYIQEIIKEEFEKVS